MSDCFLHPIDRIEPRPGYRVLVSWRAGGQSLVDFSDDVAHGQVWQPLRDEALFANVRLVNNGTVIEWPEPKRHNGEPEIDVDADGLWYMALEQNAAIAAE
jgi:hypothetical protein